ncbi:hypothetical protein [Butyrivibrio sp. VCD2006]|uniref:hypothetical protein n=1 Tax=Butyrivibrio sp. VCD2006 TaxID=1280664 RepID=UPI0003FD0174|nr:hypothetical protein [Butyrivibrio sp. VCD2006]
MRSIRFTKKEKKDQTGKPNPFKRLKKVDKHSLIKTIFGVVSVLVFGGILIGGLFILFGEYTIELDMSDGTGSYFQSYNINSGDITLGIPEREGYRFTGWTGKNVGKPNRDVTIKKGTIGDLTYVANWSKDLTVVCEDWVINKNGKPIREITDEVDKFLKDGNSSKSYEFQERVITVPVGTIANASKWGDDKSYKAYSDQYIFVRTSGDVTIDKDETVVYRYFYPVLDVNYTVNGDNLGTYELTNYDIAFFNLYVDGRLIFKNLADYCGGIPCGSEYKVVPSSTNQEYEYNTYSKNKGIMPDESRTMKLDFEPREGDCEVTCEDWLIDAEGNPIRDITSEIDSFLYAGKSKMHYKKQKRTVNYKEGTTVSGKLWGNDESYKAYSDKYSYVGSSDENIVNHNGHTVYRYFYPILDVNCYIGGKRVGDSGSVARFNVYVDDELVAEDVTDFCGAIPCGSEYRVEVSEYRDWGYILRELTTNSGKMGIYSRQLPLRFTERTGDTYVIVEDWLVDKNNNRVREITSEVDAFLKSGGSKNGFSLQPRSIRVNISDTVDAGIFGNDKRTMSYAYEYVYAGASEKKVIEAEGTKIYRYFYPVLNVDALVDGEHIESTTDIALFDVYVDGYYRGSNLSDFYSGVPCGSEYEIRRIRTNLEYEYLDIGISRGIMSDELEKLELKFESTEKEDAEELKE